MTKLLPEDLVGHFFGVGSLGETDPSVPQEYIKALKLPYTYSITALPEEDMIRQFAVLVDEFEEEGTFTLDVDFNTYREITTNDEPLMLDKEHGHSFYLMMDGRSYPFLKTQQTAPATMCFSIRDSNGKQLLTLGMFHFFQRLMTRIAKGQVNHLQDSCKTIIFCQDDPGLGHVLSMISQGLNIGLSPREIIQKTDSIYPSSVIPAFHYCDDWRQLEFDGWYPLWDSKPKLTHIDVVRYPPEVNQDQVEKINSFLKRGGGFALGALPNVDDSYSRPIIETLQINLSQSMRLFSENGVDLDLVKRNTMVSTQCGLSGASPGLSRRIHNESSKFQEIFFLTLEGSE
ncbi:MAG: hypothetical protein AM325_014680 [Candidatus Thorarchaeota archaeon SMTZ1-45]|nr:MAG: hypothetical protein AM325_16090 [Candidatus Thorarchaeota archaeon SMTZ1-45]